MGTKTRTVQFACGHQVQGSLEQKVLGCSVEVVGPLSIHFLPLTRSSEHPTKPLRGSAPSGAVLGAGAATVLAAAAHRRGQKGAAVFLGSKPSETKVLK